MEMKIDWLCIIGYLLGMITAIVVLTRLNILP